MATKKQKHEAALAKRERMLEQARLDGLKAQKADQLRREIFAERAKEAAERENHRLENILATHKIKGA